jgi:hypothetical protein
LIPSIANPTILSYKQAISPKREGARPQGHVRMPPMPMPKCINPISQAKDHNQKGYKRNITEIQPGGPGVMYVQKK